MKTVPVALQLYTVRDMIAQDLPGTLRAVKAAGYDCVEPAGLCGVTADELKAELDAAGLKAVSAHVALAEFEGKIRETLAEYKKLDCKYVVIPYLPEEERYGTPAFDKTLADIAAIGAAAHAVGMQLLYHNHDFEFTKVADGRYALDYMYDTIDPKYLATELDVCWVRVGGASPVEYLKKYANRAPVIHLKDYVGEKSAHMYELIGIKSEAAGEPQKFEFRPVGSGVQDFPAILAAVTETNAEYVVVEQDQSYTQASIDAAKQSRDYLKSLGW
ncbi:MAG: sugar phosphate isomerase/epimerase [Clostridiaceae bacterium]|nr:sugar phosphate isomerase/epimerase [Clostridiaceae bacterium]